MRVKKVCMIGDFGVGKTSLVARFVHQTFSADYLTTIGVKIDTRILDTPGGQTLKLVLWDIAGTNELSTIEQHYLQGAAGLIAVADGTRAATLATAAALLAQAQTLVGSRPAVLLVNKSDLSAQWELGDRREFSGHELRICSALTGEGVAAAFQRLAEQLLS